MTVHHLVVDTDNSIGQVDTQFVAELTGHDHRLGHDFAGQRVDLARVDDLVVNRHDGAANEVEPVGVVGHGQTEVVVSWHLCARVPRALDAEVADIERLASLVWKRFLEPQNYVNWAKSIGQEGFGVSTQESGVERRNVGLQTSNGLLNFQAIPIQIAVGDVVAVAVIKAQVRTIGFHLG